MNQNTFKETITATADAAAKSVSTAAEMTKDAARNLAKDVSSHASETMTAVQDMAADRIAETRDALGDSGDRLAETLRRAAEAQTEGSLQERVMSAVSGGVATVADTLRDRSLTEIAGDVRAFARRNPGAFAAGAAVAGFALARFFQASNRHYHLTERGGDGSFDDGLHQNSRGASRDRVRT